MVFGQGVNSSDSMPSQLQTVLNERDPSGRVDVVNLGHCGYSFYDMWYRMESEGESYGADLVLVFFSHNDLELVKCEDPANYARHVMECWDPDGPVLTRFLSAVDRIARDFRRRDRKFAFVFYETEVGSKYETYANILSETCYKRNIPFINVLANFGDAVGQQRCPLRVSRFDPHPSSQAHKIAAEGIAAGLERIHLIDECTATPQFGLKALEITLTAESFWKGGVPLEEVSRRFLDHCRYHCSSSVEGSHLDLNTAFEAMHQLSRSVYVWEAYAQSLQSKQGRQSVAAADRKHWALRKLFTGLFSLEEHAKCVTDSLGFHEPLREFDAADGKDESPEATMGLIRKGLSELFCKITEAHTHLDKRCHYVATLSMPAHLRSLFEELDRRLQSARQVLIQHWQTVQNTLTTIARLEARFSRFAEESKDQPVHAIFWSFADVAGSILDELALVVACPSSEITNTSVYLDFLEFCFEFEILPHVHRRPTLELSVDADVYIHPLEEMRYLERHAGKQACNFRVPFFRSGNATLVFKNLQAAEIHVSEYNVAAEKAIKLCPTALWTENNFLRVEFGELQIHWN